MKLTHLLPIIAAMAFPVSAAFGAGSTIEEIPLRYVSAPDLYKIVKAGLGAADASALLFVNVSTNSLGLDPANPGAKKVRELITRLDQRIPAQP